MGRKHRALARLTLGTEGFTLVETLISLIVVSVVGVALFQVLSVSKINVEDQKATLEAQQNARIALNSISEDFRHVSYGKDATQPSIVYADVDSVVFVADIFENEGAEIISYFLSPDGDGDTPNPDDTILMKTVADTTGAMLVEAPQSYGIAASGLQMRFFTGDNDELPTPVSEPETIGEIRLLVSAVSPRPVRGGSYLTITLSSTIYPRNLPLTPARARPNPPGDDGAEIPNCETITVRWTAPTQNTDGTPLELNDISHFNFYMTQDGGERSLHGRLNRTITERTVAGLENGHEYLFEVTAVSRAGVESYGLPRSVDLITGLVPDPPSNVDVQIAGTEANLSWDAVELFAGGSTIATPVYYKVYTGDAPGFIPDEDAFVGNTADWETTYTLGGLEECDQSYVKIRAVACANEGDPSLPALIVTPAPIACPSVVDADQLGASGQIDVSWSTPSTRVDGSPLDPNDIDFFKVFVDSTENVGPGSPFDMADGAATSINLTVPPCDTYYVNVMAVDQCGTYGDLCPQNEVTVALGSPCAPGPPARPGGLAQNSGSNNMQLTWNANTEDCDLAGYRIWYGHTPGGPYNGTGAAEGNSPIAVTAESVTSGNFVNFALTGLSACASYYVAVTAYDVCEPFEESPYSAEMFVDTECLPCTVALTCSPVYSTGSGNDAVTFGLHSTGDDETVVEMTPTWSGPQLLDEVWMDGTKVWASDGSAGNDGNVGPLAAGIPISPWDFDIEGSTVAYDGHQMKLVFDADMRGEDLFVDFRAGSGPCSIQGYVEASLLVDHFDDGDYNGWTVQTGNWSVSGGSLRQTNDSGNFQWIHTSVLTSGEDFILEADVNITSGGYALLQHNRDAADSRYLSYLSAWADEGHIGRLTDSYQDFAYGDYNIGNGYWYKTKVVRTGDVYQLYVNCTLVAETSINPEPPAGRFGFGAYYSKLSVDDVVITEHAGSGAAAAAQY